MVLWTRSSLSEHRQSIVEPSALSYLLGELNALNYPDNTAGKRKRMTYYLTGRLRDAGQKRAE